jgi:tetratricopeptide (TPR) repeat protein
LNDLAHVQRERGETECVTHYQESLNIFQRLADRPRVAAVAYSLGTAYKDIPALRDLDQAETWYRRSLDLHDQADRLGRAKCLGQLGIVARERFDEVRAAEGPEHERLRLINQAARFTHQAVDLLPENAIKDRAVGEGQLGNIYDDAGKLDRSLHHYRECIHLFESVGDIHSAAKNRSNVARTLARAGRLADAREYARAALRNYETYGSRAAAEIEKTRDLLDEIDELERRRS